MKTYIYILQHPINQEVKYVGKTTNTKHRYYQHTNLKMCQKKKCYLSSWLISLFNQNLKPVMTIIDETDSNDWQWLEIYWINQFKQWGFKLTNLAEGGQGGNNYRRSEETKKLLSKNNGRGRAKLTEKEVILICNLINEGKRMRYIRKQVPQLTHIMLSSIRTGKKWVHITSKYLKPPFKITQEVIDSIKELSKKGVFQKDIAKIYPISKSHIGNIINGYYDKNK